MKAIAEKTETPPSNVANSGTAATTVYIDVDLRKKKWVGLCEKELALRGELKAIRAEKNKVEKEIEVAGDLPQLSWDFEK